MKTDKENWVNLLEEMGIEFSDSVDDRDAHMILRLQQGANLVGGYLWFFINIEFDENGKFVIIGAWE